MNKNCSTVAGCRIYVVLFPCNECTKILIQSGIQQIIFYSDKYRNTEENIASRKMLDLSGISYRQVFSLTLFILFYTDFFKLLKF